MIGLKALPFCFGAIQMITDPFQIGRLKLPFSHFLVCVQLIWWFFVFMPFCAFSASAFVNLTTQLLYATGMVVLGFGISFTLLPYVVKSLILWYGLTVKSLFVASQLINVIATLYFLLINLRMSLPFLFPGQGYEKLIYSELGLAISDAFFWALLVCILYVSCLLIVVDYYFTTSSNAFGQVIDMEYRLANFKELLSRSQLKPHFLFNSMSSLRTLIHKNAYKATEMTQELGNFFSNLTDLSERALCSLDKEISLIKSYLKIQRMRFDDALAYHIDVDKHLLSCQIPPLVLYPVVENAIKYGYQTTTGKFAVGVRIFEVENNIVIRVENDGSWVHQNDTVGVWFRPQPDGLHRGLRNVEKILKIRYEGKAELKHYEKSGKVVVELVIPSQDAFFVSDASLFQIL